MTKVDEGWMRVVLDKYEVRVGVTVGSGLSADWVRVECILGTSVGINGQKLGM
jgi:hypothetical protein